MNLEAFMTQTPAYATIRQTLGAGQRQLVTGLNGSAETLFIASLLHEQQRSIVYVTDTLYHAGQLVDDLANLLDENELFEFPVEELLAAEVATSSPEYRSSRIDALRALQSERPVVIVTALSGLRRFLPAPENFAAARFTVKAGDDFDLEDLQQRLFGMGYTHQKLVAGPGDFAVRGSIIDIYPLAADYPVRLDFFDTEVDSLRYFDPATQRSIENVDEVEILPATDFILTADERAAGADALMAELTQQVAKLDEDATTTLTNQVKPLVDGLRKGSVDPQLMEFADYLFPEHHQLLDYLPANGLALFGDYSRLQDAERQLLEDEANWATDKLTHHQIFAQQTFGGELRPIIKDDPHAQVMLALFQKGMGNLRFQAVTNVVTRAMQQFFGQLPVMKTEIDRWRKQKQTVVLLVQDEERLAKIEETLDDFEIQAVLTKEENLQNDLTQLVPERLRTGFELPEANLVVITEAEMFQKVTKKRARRQTMANAERLKSYTDLKPGDYVVHVNHGIGKFIGMQTLTVDGVHQDYMTIDYQDNAQLFIPVTQLNLIQKYVSSEDKKPRINKLGGSEWAKTKSKVAAKIEDIADELVDLYAKRAAEKGFAFPKDDSLQTDFENDFPYAETPDQLRTIDEVKHDMEKARPMDRLLVGDVGYGKTEVALRAAFKAVEAGKQVAFLVPTTILAQQHYDTMVNRFEGYPINVEMFSRFRTTKQIHQSIKDLEDGQLDIVVGTHRLLSQDVKFKNLGLVLVDEEQRFGVKHKERLKQLKANVDVLTLTATPIPRTLHMSMLGVRDLSVIETPPANRFPIQTYVMEQNAGAIQDGIRREMQRGGQVFYLHNRVDDIEKTVSQIQALVPEARVGYIHGKMTEAQLEGVLFDFLRGDYDVLVTTTIIETGIDIPNANTLFVENADRMGLSQLYQLRGRIGRSNRVAYAYFTYKPNKVLTEVSEKRLEAIKDFTELGSGFKIAMRDLSIRGAGNLLGKQQHGFINSVGYDLYTQMLSDAVAKKRGKKTQPKTDTTVELGVEAYLPSDYIEDEQQKIEMYKRIRQLESDDEVSEIQADLIDRFGDYPESVAQLLTIGQLKLAADLALVDKIRRVNGDVFVTISKQGTNILGGEDVFKALAATQLKATVAVDNDRLHVKLVLQPNMTVKDWLPQVQLFMGALRDIVVQTTKPKADEK
ncbi:transcription-repair coupling factor [Levilactobacillus parabrevis]|uniref:Transcription-repair-coupling factor n=1 Tax=Levilactobacillus parabrevis ATCC 53295 TaxID=1267003 RepID=A0A0R1GL22_9LACO|nr:transcription-repair coupling factor [Levilactobacillus parabrevis]KRK34799.1 transcription-repair coupling factor [Levilactobacillus parabrevis ATCC 53295]KRO05004.1 transcription-repair coupling factor [Levilactobacillus parabrevis]